MIEPGFAAFTTKKMIEYRHHGGHYLVPFFVTMMLRRLLKGFGSIRLAVPLMAAIVVILIGATMYESQVGSSTVQEVIYKSPWFGALMFLLALNLGVSAMSRYPWRGARKVGFALTHWGLIVLIAGAAAVIHVGVEGMLLVRTDANPTNQIRVEGEFLEVIQPDQSLAQAEVVITNGQVKTRQAAGLELLDYRENTIKTVSFQTGGAVENPAVRLELRSDRMAQTVDRWLAIAPLPYRSVTMGPAELAIARAESEAELDQLLHPSTDADSHPWGTLTLTTLDQSNVIDLQTAAQSDQPIRVGDITAQVVAVFPNFQLNGKGQPISVSDEFQNPAVQLTVQAPTGKERWFVFAKPDFPPVRTPITTGFTENLRVDYAIAPPQPQDYFHVVIGPDTQCYYVAKSSQGVKSGTFKLGQTVTPGWADFQIRLADVLDHAQLHREIVPVEEPGIEGSPALRVRTAAGTEAWLPWGEPTVINEPDGGETLAAFTPKLLQLPFAVQLDDFIVDRNEGSESVAMWTSQIEIIDPAAQWVEARRVWMNHPTWYHGWKLAQASWNPGDLKQSTLQVKREPAWVTALTWIGSALVISGIAVMFYGPAVVKQWRHTESSTVPLASESEAELSSAIATPEPVSPS